MKPVCPICPRHCALDEGQTGACRARTNRKGVVVCDNYGRLTSMCLDPVEKKPLARFYPGKKILSVGSYGCNLSCPFCQNSSISMAGGSARTVYMPPEKLVERAVELVPQGNIGLAYTYNEPLVGYEYVRDCAKLVHNVGLKNVLVTNGMICSGPLLELLPFIDAMNIDLKAFTGEFYHMLGGEIATAMETIALSAARCHVEVTTLILPGKNDGDSEMEELSSWLSSVGEVPLHITRFFPRYHMADLTPTPVETIYRLRDIAKRRLKYVYAGNC